MRSNDAIDSTFAGIQEGERQMMNVQIRDLRPEDLDSVLHLWEAEKKNESEPVYGLAEVLASCQKDHAVVAIVEDSIVGVTVGRAAHAQGWVVFHAVTPRWRVSGVGERLLAALERRMAPLGLGKLSALLPESQDHAEDFIAQGFSGRKQLRYFERDLPVQGRELVLLRDLGGRILPRGLWDSVGGMATEKDLLERRLVLPLAQSAIAEEYGVVPPRTVVLFGPPGTGKTTFAKAIASRLEWSFVEVFPSRLAAEPGGLAVALRETFTKIAELQHAVIFIDEVEEIASHRRGDPPSPTQGVTNELLKLIPEFREQPGRLLICATNFIRTLDTALLRHGRFDYVIPIGLPDTAARAAIWERYIPEMVSDAVDLALLVDESDGFTPADIEYAARRASQAALERALSDDHPGSSGPQTADYVDAMRSTRATVPPQMVSDFLEDIEHLART